jgi:hypothetical protein
MVLEIATRCASSRNSCGIPSAWLLPFLKIRLVIAFIDNVHPLVCVRLHFWGKVSTDHLDNHSWIAE